MKALKEIILEKLIINKNSKIKNQSDFYIVITESNEVFSELNKQYRNKHITKPDGWVIFVLGKNEVKQLNKDDIIDDHLWVYDIPEQYRDDIEKFKDDYKKGIISYFEIKNKNKNHKLTIEDIENLD